MPGNKIILYVDDDADDRHFLRVVLQEENTTVELVEAENGLIALHYLEKVKKTGPLPCLIVLDLNMPVLDGRQTFMRISKDEALNQVPVLVFSSSTNPADKAFFEQQGAAFISKPSHISFFKTIARQILSYCN